jgi:hypothetical protein
MRWVDALKLYNQGKGGWCIPRKGTKEYLEVRKIMGGSKPAPPTEKAMRAESKPKHLKEDVLGALRKVAEDAKHRNADKAKKLLAMMEEKRYEEGTRAIMEAMKARKELPLGHQISEDVIYREILPRVPVGRETTLAKMVFDVPSYHIQRLGSLLFFLECVLQGEKGDGTTCQIQRKKDEYGDYGEISDKMKKLLQDTGDGPNMFYLLAEANKKTGRQRRIIECWPPTAEQEVDMEKLFQNKLQLDWGYRRGGIVGPSVLKLRWNLTKQFNLRTKAGKAEQAEEYQAVVDIAGSLIKRLEKAFQKGFLDFVVARQLKARGKREEESKVKAEERQAKIKDVGIPDGKRSAVTKTVQQLLEIGEILKWGEKLMNYFRGRQRDERYKVWKLPSGGISFERA